MNIAGEKVLLKAIEPDDAEILQELINDPETEYMLGGWSFPVSKLKQSEWIASLKDDKSTLRCIVEVIGTHEKIGTVILSDIDYKNGTAGIHIKLLNRGLRGKGYGFDAISALVNYGFQELRLNCIYAHINAFNEASDKLFRKCGFETEGVLRQRHFKKGSYIDVKVCSIINPRK